MAWLIINFFLYGFDSLLLLFVLPANIFAGTDFYLVLFEIDTRIFVLAGLPFTFGG